MPRDMEYLLELADIGEILETGDKSNDTDSAQQLYISGVSKVLELIKGHGIAEKEHLGHILLECSKALKRLADSICHSNEKTVGTESVEKLSFNNGISTGAADVMLDKEQKPEPEENTLLYNYKMSDIIGMENVKKVFWQTFILPKLAPQLFQHSSSWKSILLFGASGTGKTSAVCAAANESNWNYIVVVPADLVSSLYGDSEKQIKKVLQRALPKRPCIIIFDEAESLSPNRKDNTSNHDLRFSNQMLLTLSEAVEKYEDIVTVAITNTPQICDKAFMRRFQTKCFVALPSVKERKELFKKYLGVHKHDLKEKDFDVLVEESRKFSGDDIKCLTKCIFLEEAENYVYALQKKGIPSENICNQPNTMALKKKNILRFVKKWKASLSEEQDDQHFTDLRRQYDTSDFGNCHNSKTRWTSDLNKLQ